MFIVELQANAHTWRSDRNVLNENILTSKPSQHAIITGDIAIKDPYFCCAPNARQKKNISASHSCRQTPPRTVYAHIRPMKFIHLTPHWTNAAPGILYFCYTRVDFVRYVKQKSNAYNQDKITSAYVCCSFLFADQYICNTMHWNSLFFSFLVL